MGVESKDYVITYSMNKLSETARTFRRLGEAYDFADTEEHINAGFSRQLFLVSDILENCTQIQFRTEKLERSRLHDLNSRCIFNGIKYRDIHMVVDNNRKREILIQAKTLGRGCVPTRKLARIISQVFSGAFFSEECNRMTINEDFHQFVFVQEDRFRILSGVARHNKEKEKYSGDNFLLTKLTCGKMFAAIADGCGSGRRAFIESRMVIELMENSINAGFEERTAIDLINSAYIAGGGIGNPVTMDMGVIDCQSGMLNCIKLGAVSTFIKRDGWVEIIKSTTLPIGVLEQVDYDYTTKKLYDGDYVVMVSDGVLDNLPDVDKEEQMVSIIKSVKISNPQAMAEAILARSLKYNDMEAFDDCTVIVLGVFDTFSQ